LEIQIPRRQEFGNGTPPEKIEAKARVAKQDGTGCRGVSGNAFAAGNPAGAGKEASLSKIKKPMREDWARERASHYRAGARKGDLRSSRTLKSLQHESYLLERSQIMEERSMRGQKGVTLSKRGDPDPEKKKRREKCPKL